MTQNDLQSIVGHFCIDGELDHVEPFGSGHINDTYRLTYIEDGKSINHVLQKINHSVFKDPPAMTENIIRVTEHIRSKLLQAAPKQAERQLTVIKTKTGDGYHRDSLGDYWRVYNYIEDAITYDTLDSPGLAREAARMFGWFQNILIDLPGPELHETIPDFHNTPKRLKVFQEILEKDPCNRAKDCRREIDFVQANSPVCGLLLGMVDKGEIPVRVTHNDTKINNVMLDKQSQKGICVIDLDTVMPGLSLYDFGDMVRTATSPAQEDEQDLSKVYMRMEMFEMLVKGFVKETHSFLTACERKYLAFSGKLITLEQMIRFLGDHLAGDVYYKIHRANHNLDRARTQMKLVQSIIEQEDEMNALAETVFSQYS